MNILLFSIYAFFKNILDIFLFPITPLVILITFLLVKTRRYYLKIKWLRIIPPILLFFCGLYFLFTIYIIYSNTKNDIRAFIFNIEKNKPAKLCPSSIYEDNELKFSLRVPDGICNPKKNYLLKNTYVYWNYNSNKHETPLKISVGKFYDENTRIIEKDIIIKKISGKILNKAKKTVGDKIINLKFNGLNAYRLELTKDETISNNRSLNIITFQYGDLSYLFEATSSEFMNSILKSFHFTDNKPLVALPSPTPQKIKEGKNEVKLFYPAQGQTIANNSPTFTGKIRQEKELYLKTKYSLEKVPFNKQESSLYLSFLPGKLKNIDFFIDNQIIKNVYGIPQYPTVSCYLEHSTPESGYIYEPLVTQEECIQYKKNELPPVIFFFQADSKLTPGKHELTFKTTNGFTQTINFFIQPDMNLSWQNIKVDQKNNLYASDNCMSSYYYKENFLHIPIPNNPNPNLIYGLSFPQSEDEKGSILRRRVQIKFDNNKYDLLIPNVSLFYFNDEKTNSSSDSWQALFIPVDQLYYTNGIKTSPWKIKKDGGYANEYFEMFPIDLKNRYYREKSLPWETTNSSECDG